MVLPMNNFIPLNGANQMSWFALFYKVNYGTYINLILFIIIMLISFYIARYFVNRSPYAAPFKTGKVKERIFLGPQSSLVVIELQGVYYVLASDKGRTTLIDTRDDLAYEQVAAAMPDPLKFEQVISKYLKKNQDK